MPNYRYNTPEYMRRGNSCGCQQERRQMTENRQTGQMTERRTMRNTMRDDMQEDTCCECLTDMPLAMAYVPWQEWRAIYEVDKGFHCGTIFEELTKPFKGGCC